MTLSRRQFVSQFGRSMMAELSGALYRTQGSTSAPSSEAKASERRWLRPPGALLDEDAFRSACTRCTACQDVCPHDSIRRLGTEFGPDAGTPAIIPDESPCYLCVDLPCIDACEPGALQPLELRDVSMGTAILDAARCYISAGQPCDYCVTRCPLGDLAIRFGDGGVPEITPEGCAGCGVCSYLCPGGALAITPRVAESKKVDDHA